MFAQWMNAAVDRHEGLTQVMVPDYSKYLGFESFYYWVLTIRIGTSGAERLLLL